MTSPILHFPCSIERWIVHGIEYRDSKYGFTEKHRLPIPIDNVKINFPRDRLSRINNPPIPKTEWHPLFMLDYIHLRISIVSTIYIEIWNEYRRKKYTKGIIRRAYQVKFSNTRERWDRCVGNNIYSDVEAREIAMNWILHRVMGNGIYNIREESVRNFQLNIWRDHVPFPRNYSRKF